MDTKVDKKLKSYGIENLCALVKTHDLATIKKIIFIHKPFAGEYWCYRSKEHYIEHAVRDALLLGQMDTVQFFLTEGIDANDKAFDEQEKNDEPFIHFAAKSGKVEMVRLLVEHGAQFCNIKEHKEMGYRNQNYGLRTAVIEGKLEVVDYLLSIGAPSYGFCGNNKPSSRYAVTTLLARAAQDGNIGIVKSLLQHGAKIPLAINQAYQQLYVHHRKNYASALKKYDEVERIEKCESAFRAFNENRKKYLSEYYRLTQPAKDFFKRLNQLLSEPEKIINNNDEKFRIINQIKSEFISLGITSIDEKKLDKDVSQLIHVLFKFDAERRQLEQERDENKDAYIRIVKTLLDYAMGCDFTKTADEYMSCKTSLFLADLDVSDFCFIGVSVEGKPVTRTMLTALGLSGVDKAIITINDLFNIKDDNRRNNIKRIADLSAGLSVDKDGVFNFVPFCVAAAQGDIDVVNARLLAGIDPNKGKSAMNAASKNGHVEIVKILAKAHAYHSENKANQLVHEAKQKILSRSDCKTIYINKGCLQAIEPSFKSNKYVPILHERDHRGMMRLFKEIGYDHVNQMIEDIMDKAKSQALNVFLIIKRDGSATITTYDNLVDKSKLRENIVKVIKQTSDFFEYYPVIFTNQDNVDVVEEIILSQYKKFDKGNKAIGAAIDIARTNKNMALAEYLESQQDINAQDANGNTLLHKAVIDCEIDRVLELLKKGADFNIKNKDCETAIDIAAARCKPHREEVSQFLAILQHLLDKVVRVEESTLHAAIKANSEVALAMLLPYVSKEHIPYIKYNHKGDPLQCLRPWYSFLIYEAAEQQSNVALLMLLKKYGADFNYMDEEYRDTLLSCAIGLLPSYSRSTESTCHRSIRESREKFDNVLKLINYLLDNGCDPRIGCKIYGTTPLHSLINDKDLSFLEGNGYEEILDKLLSKNADINAVDAHGSTPLHLAVTRGYFHAVTHLIQHKANINVQDKNGNTPLHVAAAKCCSKSIKHLFEAGSDVYMENNEGLSALQLLEMSYKTKLDKLEERHRKAKEDRRTKPNTFFGYSENYRIEAEKICTSILNEISKLEGNYYEAKSILSSNTVSVRPQ